MMPSRKKLLNSRCDDVDRPAHCRSAQTDRASVMKPPYSAPLYAIRGAIPDSASPTRPRRGPSPIMLRRTSSIDMLRAEPPSRARSLQHVDPAAPGPTVAFQSGGLTWYRRAPGRPSAAPFGRRAVPAGIQGWPRSKVARYHSSPSPLTKAASCGGTTSVAGRPAVRRKPQMVSRTAPTPRASRRARGEAGPERRSRVAVEAATSVSFPSDCADSDLPGRVQKTSDLRSSDSILSTSRSWEISYRKDSPDRREHPHRSRSVRRTRIPSPSPRCLGIAVGLSESQLVEPSRSRG